MRAENVPAYVSVLICSHNPRPHYLNRVFAALRCQSLPYSEWELLLVDNASQESLATKFDLSWHPQARHVREERLGIVYARARSISESRGEALVFVDDDNVLEADYLAVARQISEQRPELGAWGGSIRAEFETPPPAWSQAFWNILAVREVDDDRWLKPQQDSWIPTGQEIDCLPWGAGMCFRRQVGNAYLELMARDPNRAIFGRRGNNLASTSEDVDIALTACDIGLGIGTFRSLRLTHLIPSARLEPAYILRLVYGAEYSWHILRFVRAGIEPARPSWPGLAKLYLLSLGRPRYERARFIASRRALKQARKTIAELRAQGQGVPKKGTGIPTVEGDNVGDVG